MDHLFYEANAYYILDRGYVDFERLHKITQHSAYFVVRAKSNQKFTRMYSRKHDKLTGVKSDQIGKLSGFFVAKQYTNKLIKIKFYDQETERTFIFLTNNFEFTEEQIVFFKLIKQHLKIKAF